MISKLLALLIVLTGFTHLEGLVKKNECQYYLSVCAIFRDEGPYLKEWIEYHRMVGVQHFYLYNNSSSDNYLDILEPYLKAGIVELLDWHSTPETYVPAQKSAYNHCLQKNIGVTYWLAPIDLDEFIVPVSRNDLIEFLSEFDNQPYLGAIHINWQLYGTSFLPSIPKDKLLIESLTLKAPSNYSPKERPNNTVFKSIVKPEAIEKYKIHHGTLKNKFYEYPKKAKGFQQPVQIDRIRLNHYWTRAEDFFYSVKINRRMQIRNDRYLSVIMQKLLDLNQVEDKIMNRFVPKLRQRMALPN